MASKQRTRNRGVEGIDWAWCRTCGAGGGLGFVYPMSAHLHHFVVQRKSDGKYRLSSFDGRGPVTYYISELRGASRHTDAAATWIVENCGSGLQAVPLPAEWERGLRTPKPKDEPPILRRVDL